jgi:hypothetical protein
MVDDSTIDDLAISVDDVKDELRSIRDTKVFLHFQAQLQHLTEIATDYKLLAESPRFQSWDECVLII